jgi:hypothetical protein
VGSEDAREIKRLRKEVTRLFNGVELIMQEAISHEDKFIKEMAKNILAGKDPYHHNGD